MEGDGILIPVMAKPCSNTQFSLSQHHCSRQSHNSTLLEGVPPRDQAGQGTAGRTGDSRQPPSLWMRVLLAGVDTLIYTPWVSGHPSGFFCFWGSGRGWELDSHSTRLGCVFPLGMSIRVQTVLRGDTINNALSCRP